MDKRFDNIGIENFRVFNEKQNFKFADITVLAGTNSSGKSSLINALKFLQSSFKNANENGVAIMNYLFNNIDHEFARKNFGALKGILNRKNSSDSFFITNVLNVSLFSFQLSCQVKYVFKVQENKLPSISWKELIPVTRK